MSDRRPDANRRPGTAEPGRLVCAYCAAPILPNGWLRALVPDSSVIHREDASFDGRREVVACGPEHLEELIRAARSAWSDEQLWFGRLARASQLPGVRVISLRALGERARLTGEHLRRALEWNARQDDPVTTLPGGQRLPSLPTTPDGPGAPTRSGPATGY